MYIFLHLLITIYQKISAQAHYYDDQLHCCTAQWINDNNIYLLNPFSLNFFIVSHTPTYEDILVGHAYKVSQQNGSIKIFSRGLFYFTVISSACQSIAIKILKVLSILVFLSFQHELNISPLIRLTSTMHLTLAHVQHACLANILSSISQSIIPQSYSIMS